MGLKNFRQGYEGLAGRTYRLRFGRDIVPSVPTLAMGYRHVGLHLHCPEGRFGGTPEAVVEEPRGSEAAIQALLREIEEHRRFLEGLREIGDRLPPSTVGREALGGLPLPADVREILDRLPAPRVPSLPFLRGVRRAVGGLLGIGRTPLRSPFLTPPPKRPDLLGALFEQLPPPIRDHLPHRYLGAL